MFSNGILIRVKVEFVDHRHPVHRPERSHTLRVESVVNPGSNAIDQFLNLQQQIASKIIQHLPKTAIGERVAEVARTQPLP